MVSEEIDFEISRSDLLLRLCDDWCCHQNFSLIFDFTRLRLGLQIDIFRIIAQGSDFPEITLQNCKSDMTTPLKLKNQNCPVFFDEKNVLLIITYFKAHM